MPAFVGYVAERLLQHQGIVDIHPVEPASAEIVDQRLVVDLGIVSAQRQLEAILALGRAVTGALVATGPCQDGFDFADESDRRAGESRHGHGQTRRSSGGGDRDRRRTGGLGIEVAVLTERDPGSGDLKPGVRGEINACSIGAFTGHQHLSGIPCVLKRQGCGFHVETFDGRQRGLRRDDLVGCLVREGGGCG